MASVNDTVMASTEDTPGPQGLPSTELLNASSDSIHTLLLSTDTAQPRSSSSQEPTNDSAANMLDKASRSLTSTPSPGAIEFSGSPEFAPDTPPQFRPTDSETLKSKSPSFSPDSPPPFGSRNIKAFAPGSSEVEGHSPHPGATTLGADSLLNSGFEVPPVAIEEQISREPSANTETFDFSTYQPPPLRSHSAIQRETARLFKEANASPITENVQPTPEPSHPPSGSGSSATLKGKEREEPPQTLLQKAREENLKLAAPVLPTPPVPFNAPLASLPPTLGTEPQIYAGSKRKERGDSTMGDREREEEERRNHDSRFGGFSASRGERASGIRSRPAFPFPQSMGQTPVYSFGPAEGSNYRAGSIPRNDPPPPLTHGWSNRGSSSEAGPSHIAPPPPPRSRSNYTPQRDAYGRYSNPAPPGNYSESRYSSPYPHNNNNYHPPPPPPPPTYLPPPTHSTTGALPPQTHFDERRHHLPPSNPIQPPTYPNITSNPEYPNFLSSFQRILTTSGAHVTDPSKPPPKHLDWRSLLLDPDSYSSFRPSHLSGSQPPSQPRRPSPSDRQPRYIKSPPPPREMQRGYEGEAEGGLPGLQDMMTDQVFFDGMVWEKKGEMERRIDRERFRYVHTQREGSAYLHEILKPVWEMEDERRREWEAWRERGRVV